MFRDYFFATICAACAFAAMLAFPLALILPAPLAAVIAVMAALLWAGRTDQVAKRFQTDYDRVIGNDPRLKIAGSWVTIAGMLMAYVLAGFWSASISVVIGIVSIGLFAKATFK